MNEVLSKSLRAARFSLPLVYIAILIFFSMIGVFIFKAKNFILVLKFKINYQGLDK